MLGISNTAAMTRIGRAFGFLSGAAILIAVVAGGEQSGAPAGKAGPDLKTPAPGSQVAGLREPQTWRRLGEPTKCGIPITTSASTREARASCTAQLGNEEQDSASLVGVILSRMDWAVGGDGCRRSEAKSGRGTESQSSGLERWIRPFLVVTVCHPPMGRPSGKRRRGQR